MNAFAAMVQKSTVLDRWELHPFIALTIVTRPAIAAGSQQAMFAAARLLDLRILEVRHM